MRLNSAFKGLIKNNVTQIAVYIAANHVSTVLLHSFGNLRPISFLVITQTSVVIM